MIAWICSMALMLAIVLGVDNPVKEAHSLLERTRVALQNAGVLLRVPKDASSREVRKAGAKSWLWGLICVAICGAGAPALERLGLGEDVLLWLMVPYLVAFYLLIVGGYRVLLGKSPQASVAQNPYEVSWRRTLIATAVAALSFAVALGVIVPVAWLAEKLIKQ